MVYRDPARGPSGGQSPWLDRLLGPLVWIFAPLLVPPLLLRDAWRLGGLALGPRAIATGPLDALRERLAREPPVAARRWVGLSYTIASGEEEDWHAIRLTFRDGDRVLVASFWRPPTQGSPSRDLVREVLDALPPTVPVKETTTGISGLALAIALPGTAIATLGALLLAGPPGLAAVVPLSTALLLHAIARRGADRALGR